MVKYLFTLCILLLNGFHQVSGHTLESNTTNSVVIIESNSESGFEGDNYNCELHKSNPGHSPLFEIEATDVQEEENKIASPFLVFANSKFLTAAVCAFFFLFLFRSLKKGIFSYRRLLPTAIPERYVLFCDFRI